MTYIVSDATKRRIHDLHSQGLSMTDIAVAMGWGERGKNKVCGIIWRMRKNGIAIPMRGSPINNKLNNITANAAMEIVQKLRAGHSVRSVADECGVSADQVKRIRTANKIARNPTMAVIPAPAQNVIPFPVTPKPRPVGQISWQCCQYPVGPRLSAAQSYIFCESPDVVHGKPYCAKHCKEAYVPQRPRDGRRSQFIDCRKRAV